MQVLVWVLLQALQASAASLLLSCKATKVLKTWKCGRHVCPGWLLLLLLQRCRSLLLCTVHLRTTVEAQVAQSAHVPHFRHRRHAPDSNPASTVACWQQRSCTCCRHASAATPTTPQSCKRRPHLADCCPASKIMQTTIAIVLEAHRQKQGATIAGGAR
jgi:hypothetical protein